MRSMAPVATSDTSAVRGDVLRRLLPYLAPYRSQMLGTLVLVLVSAAVQAGGPALIGRAIDGPIAAGDAAGLGGYMFALLAIYVIGVFTQGGQIFLVGVIGQRFLAALRAMVFDKVQALPLSFFDRTRAGDLMSRLVNDIQQINQLISQGLAQVLGNLFALLGIVVAMVLLSPPLALATLVTIPLIIAATSFFTRRSRVAFQRTRETVGELSAQLQEDLAGVRVTQAFSRENQNIRAFGEVNAANRNANVQAGAISSAFTPAIGLLSTLATMLVALVGGWLALRDEVPVGTVVAFFIYVQQFFRPIQIISNVANQLQAAAAGAERIFDLIDEPVRMTEQAGALTLPAAAGRVAFEGVQFSYGDQIVLDNVDLLAEPGQTIALVGPTGAGKSTLVNLVPRFYDVQQGRVTIDGVDVRAVTLASLRGQIGQVLQENFLFSGTVADNIRYGRLQASDAEVEQAAQAIGAHEFISALPEGYKTKVGERGSGVSQGQRQLITIARAVLANPRILILDEATSSVDTRTEEVIQAGMKRLLQGRTAFVIAHRLSTIREADQVLFIDGGKIVERGTHDELLALNGRYAELYRRQFAVQS